MGFYKSLITGNLCQFILICSCIMQAQKSPKQQVESYIEQMNNYDPDLQEMGAKYLSELVLSDKVNLIEEPDLARKITENFLKQVASLSFVVHSSAIRFLAEMVPKLPKKELLHIFHQTISAIAKPDTPSERREVFSTAAGTMIHLAPDDFGHALSDLFVESINQLMVTSSSKPEIEMLLLNVVTEFTRKWPNVAGSPEVKFDRRGFIQYLLKNIQLSNKLILVRKSDGALEKVCLIFNRDNFEFLFNEKQHGILSFIRHHSADQDEDGLKQLRNGMMSLCHVVKGMNPEMKPWAKQICVLAIEILVSHKNIDRCSEVITEIVEYSISTLTYIVKAYSSEISDLITGNSDILYNFIEEALDFDLECTMTYIEEGMEEADEYEDEEAYYYTDDSICWKVRAATLRYITILMHKDKSFRERKAKSSEFLSLLARKLVEENENVSKMAFECFNYIIESISTTKNVQDLEEDLGFGGLRRVKSSDGEFAVDIVSQISDQIAVLFRHSKTKEEIKTEASKTLLHIIQLLKETIKDNEELNKKLLDLVLDLSQKVNIDSCINLLRAVRSLMPAELPIERIEQMINLYLKYTKNPNLKVSSTSFSGLRTIEKIYGQKLVRLDKYKLIFGVIIQKVKEHDAEKIIKVSVVRCIGPIFEGFFQILDEKSQNTLLEVVEEKLRIQIDKSLILLQLSKISPNYEMKKTQEKVFASLLELASENLGTANFELNANAIDCCDRLIRIMRSTITDKTTAAILDKCKPLLFESKIPPFLDVLLETHPKAFKNHTELIVRTADSNYIMSLINKKIIDSDSCIKILKGVAKPQNSKDISLILSKLNIGEKQLKASISDEQWGLISLGALGFIGNVETFKFLLDVMENDKRDDVKFQAARSIGNIASRNPQLSHNLMQLCSKVEDGYLYIFALKEMLHFSEKEFEGLPKILLFLFQKGEESNRETNQYAISESIGEVSRISPREMRNILNSINDMNESRKFIVASSLRFALEGKTVDREMVPEETEFYIKCIMGLASDASLNVRYAAIKSLNSISGTFSFVLETLITEQFIRQLLDSILIKPENIIIVDYGVNKEKKDLGKPLRIEAFNFLRSILNFRKIEAYHEEIIAKSISKLNEETSNDLILKRVNIIKRICEKDFTLFIPYEHDFEIKLGVEEGVLKAHQKQAAIDDERNEGYLKSLLKEIIEIRNMADKEGNDKIRAFVNNIRRSERLSKVIDSLGA